MNQLRQALNRPARILSQSCGSLPGYVRAPDYVALRLPRFISPDADGDVTGPRPKPGDGIDINDLDFHEPSAGVQNAVVEQRQGRVIRRIRADAYMDVPFDLVLHGLRPAAACAPEIGDTVDLGDLRMPGFFREEVRQGVREGERALEDVAH